MKFQINEQWSDLQKHAKYMDKKPITFLWKTNDHLRKYIIWKLEVYHWLKSEMFHAFYCGVLKDRIFWTRTNDNMHW